MLRCNHEHVQCMHGCSAVLLPLQYLGSQATGLPPLRTCSSGFAQDSWGSQSRSPSAGDISDFVARPLGVQVRGPAPMYAATSGETSSPHQRGHFLHAWAMNAIQNNKGTE